MQGDHRYPERVKVVRKNRSRTFAVIEVKGEALDLYVLYRRIDIETDDAELISKKVQGWHPEDQELLLRTLNSVGVVSRYFDKKTETWKQVSEIGGVSTVRGSKDGSWRLPDVDEFERDYLAVA